MLDYLTLEDMSTRIRQDNSPVLLDPEMTKPSKGWVSYPSTFFIVQSIQSSSPRGLLMVSDIHSQYNYIN